jgi:hypothetical protein
MKRVFGGLAFLSMLLAACTTPFGPTQRPGVAWAPGSFDSNGERIYFTATNDRGQRIPYRGGPDVGMKGTIWRPFGWPLSKVGIPTASR